MIRKDDLCRDPLLFWEPVYKIIIKGSCSYEVEGLLQDWLNYKQVERGQVSEEVWQEFQSIREGLLGDVL